MANIREVVQQYGLELINEGNVIRAFCCFHHDTGRPNFTIFDDTNRWHCYACGTGGDAAYFVSKIEDISYREAKLRLDHQIVDLQELQEKIDGAGFADEEPTFNVDADIVISKLARAHLYSNSNSISEVFSFLNYFDDVNSKPLPYNLMKDVLAKARSTFQTKSQEKPVQYSINKSYSRTISRNYQTWKFSTSLSETIEVNSKEELEAASGKLFKQARALTDMDIKAQMAAIEKELSGE